MDASLMLPFAFALSIGFLIAVVKTALGLGFVIFVHELGHFMVAKMCGVKCEKFYIGFDAPLHLGPLKLPRTLFKRQWGETEYGIGIIPLGGYVKMLGQDDNPANAAKEAERARAQSPDGATDDHPPLDPRSYPAKTVTQRLMIISAGVVMNLIFAVIFAMVAYRMGVSYTPTVVGSTSPGLSAWQIGLQPGDRVIQMGRDGQPSEHLRFDKDMMVKVMMTGAGQDLDLLVQRRTRPGDPPQPPEWVQAHLSNPPAELRRPIIGISPPLTTSVATSPENQQLLRHLPGLATEPPLAAGDTIVALNQVPIADFADLSREMVRQSDVPWTLEVERPADPVRQTAATKLAVHVKAYEMRGLGLILGMGPITAVKQHSPAAVAGLKPNDRLVSLNGKPIGDPMQLPSKLRRLAGQEVTLEVERDGHHLTLTAQPELPQMLHLGMGLGQPIAADELGIAYTIENQVVAIEPNSPAASSGIAVGDLLETAEFVPANNDDAALEAEIFVGSKPIDLGAEHLNWPRVFERLRVSLPNTKVKLAYKRGDHLLSCDMTPVTVAGEFYADRGLDTLALEEVNQVDSWTSSLHLGLQETWDAMRQVYFMLFRLVTGRISPKNLGGPVSIAAMAGAEASESTARLLVFLTLLSANLAVVNFLPIPVLDGGHAMFLLYEGIFRRPVNERIAFGLTMLGFCFIIGLMLFVLGLDVLRHSGLAG